MKKIGRKPTEPSMASKDENRGAILSFSMPIRVSGELEMKDKGFINVKFEK